MSNYLKKKDGNPPIIIHFSPTLTIISSYYLNVTYLFAFYLFGPFVLKTRPFLNTFDFVFIYIKKKMQLYNLTIIVSL